MYVSLLMAPFVTRTRTVIHRSKPLIATSNILPKPLLSPAPKAHFPALPSAAVMFQQLMTHFVTRTQLARVTPFIHRPRSLLGVSISCSQTLSSLQFSSNTSAFSRRLPKHLSENVLVLSCESSAKGGVCQVYLVGTCHFSKESGREVQAIVKFLKPQVVFLELYSGHAAWLISEMIGGFDALPFRVACAEAIKHGGSVILGDRPLEVKSIDDKDESLTPFWQEMSKEFPAVVETMVHERDQYMSSKLLKVAKKNSCVVAVVGKGHLQGIKKYWKQPIVMEDLMKVPASGIKTLTSVALAAVGLTNILHIYLSAPC